MRIPFSSRSAAAGGDGLERGVMAVICFGSLKGGVGKTSLSVNVAHAFAERGCETLLIDLDPMGHASRFFRQRGDLDHCESPLARLLLGSDLPSIEGIDTPVIKGQNGKAARGSGNSRNGDSDNSSLNGAEPVGLVERAIAEQIPLVVPVRERLALLRSGPELRYFLWGRGSRAFKHHFQALIEELHCSYDYIVIDTPPDFNVLTRNAIASSELVVVPVDSSAMSIHCLEEVVANANHIKGPKWAIVRSMVTRQASRMQRLTSNRLQEAFQLQTPEDAARKAADVLAAEEAFAEDEVDITDPENFIALVERRERGISQEPSPINSDASAGGESPILLLNSVIFRSEQQNKMTFLGATAFDSKGDKPLREQYGAVAREVDFILSLSIDDDPLMDVENSFPMALGLQ